MGRKSSFPRRRKEGKFKRNNFIFDTKQKFVALHARKNG